MIHRPLTIPSAAWWGEPGRSRKPWWPWWGHGRIGPPWIRQCTRGSSSSSASPSLLLPLAWFASSLTRSVFYSELKTWLFGKSFPPWTFSFRTGLILRPHGPFNFFLFCSTAGFVCMVCSTKTALSRFSNALKIIELSFQFRHNLTRERALSAYSDVCNVCIRRFQKLESDSDTGWM